MHSMDQMGKHYKATWAPAMLISGSIITYLLWLNKPYGQVFPHCTISEYIPKHNYLHAILIAPISLQTIGHSIVYGPPMLYSFLLASRSITNVQFMAVYTINAMICAAVTIYYEKQKNGYFQIDMMSPKCVGAITPLAFMSTMLAIKPQHLLLNRTALPYFIIPLVYYMYELQELQYGYVNELCRPAHIAACINGLICGLILKRFI